MASKIIGRAACPLCDFEAAHVKESEKCAFLYCPSCGCQLHTKNARQADMLRAKMRPTEQAPAAPAAAPAPAPAPTKTAAPAPAALTAPPAAPRRGLLGLIAGG